MKIMILLFAGLLALGSAGKPAPSGTQWPEQCGHSLGSFVTDAVEHCDVPRLRVLENWVRWANNTFPGRGRGPPTGGDNDCDGLCVDGKDGLACWDNDADSVCDDAEDVNRDGFCDVLDCKGRNGADGRDGRDGHNGVACWDTNGDGRCNKPQEDTNGDGACNVLDCRGRDGQDGAPGTCPDTCTGSGSGQACWDLNNDGECTKPDEDTNGDGKCDVYDCRGHDGNDGDEGPQGPPGPAGPPGTCPDTCTGGGVVTNGTDGLACWDLNGDGLCETDPNSVTGPLEDTNGDGLCDARDCKGAPGEDGADASFDAELCPGETRDPGDILVVSETVDPTCLLSRQPDTVPGLAGLDGEDGLACWDLNGDGLCETSATSVTGPLEDVTGDDICDARDCKGADGQDGADASFNTLLCPGESLDEGDMLTVSANPDPKCLLSGPPAPSSGGDACGPRVAWVPAVETGSTIATLEKASGFYRNCGSYVQFGLGGEFVLNSEGNLFQLFFRLPFMTTPGTEPLVGQITGQPGRSASGLVRLEVVCTNGVLNNEGIAQAFFSTNTAILRSDFYFHGEYNIAPIGVEEC